MSITKQQQTLALSLEIMDMAQTLKHVYDSATSLSARYANQGTQSVLNSLPTAVQNADGTLGTADVTPVVGNPIDTRLVPSLARAVSAQDIIAAKNTMNDFISFMTNVVVTQKDRTASLDHVIGGS